MKKLKIFYFIFLASFYTTTGQEIIDNFENETITNWIQNGSNHWNISTESPITSVKSLKHNISNTAGNSYISRNTSSLDINNKNTTWQFNLKNGSWDPSGSNKFWIYLTANLPNLNSEEINGYAVGVNLTGSTDIITLWKVTNGNADEALITSNTNWNANETKGIRVTRDITGKWHLFIDEDGGFDNLISTGTPHTNSDYTFNNYFGLNYIYTATRAGLLWLDDVLIENTSPSTNPTISFENTTRTENETNSNSNILIPVTLINYESDITINITVNSNSTAENEDYLLNTNTLIFEDNGTQNISLTLNNDDDFDNETLIFNISTNYINTDITTPEYTLTIIDDDIPIVINEILADPDSTNGDANGDGVINSSQDEFIEIYNKSTTELDISGWTLDDLTKTRHVFPENTIIPKNETIVIFGGGTPTNIHGLHQTASSGSLVLNNTGDVITIKNTNGNIIVTETYNSEANNNQSIARNDDIFGVFTQHTTIETNPVLFSPGKINTSNLPFSSNTLSTEIEFENEKNIHIYNTLHKEKHITISGLTNKTMVKVFSILGKEHFNTTTSTTEPILLDLSNLNAGIYIITIQYDHHILSKKIILK